MPLHFWTKKDERQYRAIEASCGCPKKDAQRIAAATVNKRRAAEGRARATKRDARKLDR